MRCSRHANIETDLSCGRCGTPICPRCLVQTDVGIRCPRCASPARRNLFAVILGWLVLLPLWQAIFRPKILQLLFVTATALVWLIIIGGIIGAAVGGGEKKSQSASQAVQANSTAQSNPAVPPTAVQETTPTPLAAECSTGTLCASSGDFLLLISGIDRNWQRPPPGQYELAQNPDPGFHLVRVEATLTVTKDGAHEVDPTNLALLDPLGAQQSSNPFFGSACRSESSFQKLVLSTGQSRGPEPFCFEAAGPTDGPLTLRWFTLGALAITEMSCVQVFPLPPKCKESSSLVEIPLP